MSEDMSKLFQMMKIELEKQTATITQNVTDSLMQAIDSKIQPLIEENKNLRTEVQTLNKKIKYLEEANKKNNLILHGVKEKENNYEELFNMISSILQMKNVTVNKYEINKYHRLGLKQEGKTRPIIIAITSYQKR